MVIHYRNIQHPVLNLQNEVDRFLGGFAMPALERFRLGAGRAQPPVNLWESSDALVLEMEVPGVKTDQFDLSVVGEELSIKVEYPQMEQEGPTCHRHERPVGTFTRVLRLPVEIDGEKASAELQDGVLTITMPKAERAHARKIEVTSA